MDRRFDDPFMNILPFIDLHGETRDTIRALVLDFIKINMKMGKYKVLIIHGRGEGILKEATHEILKRHEYVERYQVYGSNDGVTIVELKRETKTGRF